MTIRRKLLLLLLAIALIPLIAMSVLHQISIRVAGHQLAAKTREALDSNARLALQQLLQNYGDLFNREKRLVDSLIRRQAREVETRLSQESARLTIDNISEDYGFNPQLEDLADLKHEYFDNAVGKDGAPLQISYRRQGYFLAEGAGTTDVAGDMDRLRTMTDVYHEIYRLAPGSILWQYTSLENGLHTSYPAGGELPNQQSYDPRKRRWYQQAKANDSIIRVGPIVDAATGQTIVTIAVAVRRPDGSFAGVTAMDRTIPDILANMKLPGRWAEGAERMLVGFENEADPCDAELTILLQSSYIDAGSDWQRRIELEKLQSQDSEQLRQMVSDIRSGRSGVRKMEYKGTPSLWAYGRPEFGSTAAVLIVPYKRVVDLAESTSEFLLKESMSWLQISGFILMIVVGAAVVLAAMRAGSLTRPISELTEAGKKLAGGDYGARVNITTGDELQQLGAVFNETGPKLKEREKMKRSLELAKAIQQNLLPKESPELTNFEVAGCCKYCDETGGDYYDYIDLIELVPGKIGIAVGDVSGHGIGAALLMTTARSMLRTDARYHGTDLVKLFDEFNRRLVQDTAEDKFMTLFFGILDDNSRSLVWVSGGHDPAFWYHHDSGGIEELPNTGMLMGLTKDASFEQAGPVRLKKGDLVVIGTDGIWEAQNIHSNMFGKERLLEIIAHASGRKAQNICSQVVESVTQFCGSVAQKDDITLVVVKAV
jgi:sigma-B regulation protein RsbU (phosphoserine phosphatase)